MAKADCPTCGAEIHLVNRPRAGQTVICPTCEMPSWVSSVTPLKLDWADLGDLPPVVETIGEKNGRRRRDRGVPGRNHRHRRWPGDVDEEDGPSRKRGRRPRYSDDDWD